ncbi:MAG: FliA/WhiG family RNA polymerase sigma factor [Microthrixaceae bacterium]
MDGDPLNGQRVPDHELAELWRQYRARPSRTKRDRIIVHYAALVKYVAGRVASGLPRNVEVGDLVSSGMFGLIEAVERFDPDRGFKFETYAIPRIRGAMTDEMRAMDWVPRSVRSKARRIEEGSAKLQARLGRAPTDEELAGELRWTEADLHRALTKISSAGLVALDELGGPGGDGDGELADDSRSPTAHLDAMSDRQLLSEAMSGAGERERTVLGLYYYEGLTLAEIGEVLGVTESRVCQIHAKAMLGLRSRFNALGNAHA